MPDRPQRVVLYIRVSALMGRGGDDFHSPDVQHTALTRHVAPLGMKVVGEIRDIDVPGRTFIRDGIDTLRGMVDAGQVDAVGLYDLSRLGRNVQESLTFIAWLRERGVTVVSTKEQIDDSPTGQFMLTQFLALAQLQGDQIGQRWAEIIEARARAGIQHGSTPPIGYRRVDKRLVKHPSEANAVTLAFARYAAGWTVSNVAQAMTRARGKRTGRRILKQMFANPVYLGKVVLHGEVVADDAHPALVSETTWDAVQDRLERDRRTPPRTLAVSHELVGILFCAHCGLTLKRNDEYQKSGRRVRRVTCNFAYKMYGDTRCEGVGNPALDPILEHVLAELQARGRELRTDQQTWVAARARKARASSDVTLIEQELAEARAALAKLAVAWARNQLTDAEHAAAVKDLRASELELRERIGELKVSAAAPPPAQTADMIAAVLERWPKLTIQERNLVLREFVKRVHVRRFAYPKEPVADRVTVAEWTLF